MKENAARENSERSCWLDGLTKWAGCWTSDGFTERDGGGGGGGGSTQEGHDRLRQRAEALD